MYKITFILALLLIGCGGGGSGSEKETPTTNGAATEVEPVAQKPKPAPASAPAAPATSSTPITNNPVQTPSAPVPYYPKLIVKIVAWGDGVNAEIDAGIPEMRKKFKDDLNIDLDIRRFELGDAVTGVVPDVQSAFFGFYLRGLIGKEGAMILVGGGEIESTGGNGSGYACRVGCSPGCCHCWCRKNSVRTGGNLWYELGHLLGTPGGADLWVLGAVDLKKQIELINRGGY